MSSGCPSPGSRPRSRQIGALCGVALLLGASLGQSTADDAVVEELERAIPTWEFRAGTMTPMERGKDIPVHAYLLGNGVVGVVPVRWSLSFSDGVQCVAGDSMGVYEGDSAIVDMYVRVRLENQARGWIRGHATMTTANGGVEVRSWELALEPGQTLAAAMASVIEYSRRDRGRYCRQIQGYWVPVPQDERTPWQEAQSPQRRARLLAGQLRVGAETGNSAQLDSVLVAVAIGRDGKAIGAAVVPWGPRDAGLSSAVRATARNWRFAPARFGDKPITSVEWLRVAVGGK